MNVFESDLTEALFEVIARTQFQKEGERYLRDIEVNEYNVELDKNRAKITLTNNKEEFTITVNKTWVGK